MERHPITAARRWELSLLVMAAAIAALALALTALGLGQHWSRALRALAPAGALVATSLLLDLLGARRDRVLLPLVALLTSLGVVLLYRLPGPQATKQILWVVIGCAALVGTYALVDRVGALANWKYLAGALALGLMVATVAFGVERNGARLWLSFGGRFSFQPSELAKLLMVIFLAGFVAEKSRVLRGVAPGRLGVSVLQARYLAPMLLMVALCLALFVGQRDLGTAALFFGLFVTMMYLATGRPVHVVLSVALFAVGVVAAYYYFPHVARRVDIWLNPWADPTGAGYQPLQGLFALAEGGVTGAGPGLLPASDLPAAGTDLIFAVLGQDLGLAGAVALLLAYGLLIWQGCRLAWQARHAFDGLLAAGITAMFALQVLLIVGGVLRLIPLTGLPLPFVGYGGTSMLVNFIALGLLLTVSRESAPSRERTGSA